jgi:putative endopeptidase
MLHLSHKVSPGVDFYTFVNEDWHSHAHIPGYEADFGISEEIEYAIQKQLFPLIQSTMNSVKGGVEVSATGEQVELRDSTKILGTLAQSILDPPNPKQSLHFLKTLLRSYSCMRDTEDVMRAMAECGMSGISVLLECVISRDTEKEDSTLYFTIEPNFPGLHYSYYTSSSKNSIKTLKSYKSLLKKLSRTCKIPSISGWIEFEKSIVDSYLSCNNESLKSIRGSDLERKFPTIPWDAFFQTYGLPTWRRNKLLIRSFEWIRIVQSMLHDFSMEDWASFFQKQTLWASLKYLPPPFNTYRFLFLEKALQGKTRPFPRSVFCVLTAMDVCKPIVSELYRECCMDPSLPTEGRAFAELLRNAAQRRMKENTWMNPETKKKAIEKLERMKLEIAVPKRWKQTRVPEHLDPSNLLQNVFVLRKQEFLEVSISEIGNKIIYWDDGVYEVNAYYYSDLNELILPAGTMVAPYFSKDASFAWNCGALGAIIGHEMTHAFDMDGKDYDEKGKQQTWWTAHDTKMYTDKTKDIITLFSKQKIQAHHVNGSLTLSENIADLGGLAIALDACLNNLAEHANPQELRSKTLQEFFTSFAVSWRTIFRKKKAFQALSTDRHAPPKFRVNLTVSQFDEWYEAFSIQPSHPLYVKPEERIRIF